jgi:hypothetical protein
MKEMRKSVTHLKIFGVAGDIRNANFSNSLLWLICLVLQFADSVTCYMGFRNY